MQEKRPACLHTMGVKVGQSSARLEKNSNRLSVCVCVLSLSLVTPPAPFGPLSPAQTSSPQDILLYYCSCVRISRLCCQFVLDMVIVCGDMCRHHQSVPKKGAEGRGNSRTNVEQTAELSLGLKKKRPYRFFLNTPEPICTFPYSNWSRNGF